MKQALIDEINLRMTNAVDEDTHMFFDAILDSLTRFNKAILAVQALIDNSEGVNGLHKNGEASTWEMLLAGGLEEEWLGDFSDATGHTLCL